MNDGTDDGTDVCKGRRPPDRLRILYKKTREFVSFKGAVLLLTACLIRVCVGGGGEWVP